MAFLCIGLSNQDYHAPQSDYQHLDSRRAVLGTRRPGRRQPARLVRRPLSGDLLGECRCAPRGADGLEQVCGRRPQAYAKAEAGIVIMDAGLRPKPPARTRHRPQPQQSMVHGPQRRRPQVLSVPCRGLKGGVTGGGIYPSATSRIIISTKPKATPTVAMLECVPACDSGISSSTTT